jgi:hypothetical protein
MSAADGRMRADALLEQRLRLIGVIPCGGHQRREVEPDGGRRVAIEAGSRRGQQLVGTREISEPEGMQRAGQLHLRRRLRTGPRRALERACRIEVAAESLVRERQVMEHRRRGIVELGQRFEPAHGVVPSALTEREEAELMPGDRIVG